MSCLLMKGFIWMWQIINKNSELGEGVRIYNLDETALRTVHTLRKILAADSKRLNKVTSGERGILVTGFVSIERMELSCLLL